jgi:hypothetical protein
LIETWELIIRGMETLANRIIRSARFTPSGCVEWTGSLTTKKYGKFKRLGVYHLAHRASYAAFVGPVPPKMMVCHTCDNRKCIRPDHLFLGTARDNNHDMMAKGRARLGLAPPPPPRRGAAHHKAKLTDDIIRRIRAGGVGAEWARRLNVNEEHIRKIRRRHIWKHVT